MGPSPRRHRKALQQTKIELGIFGGTRTTPSSSPPPDTRHGEYTSDVEREKNRQNNKLLSPQASIGQPIPPQQQLGVTLPLLLPRQTTPKSHHHLVTTCSRTPPRFFRFLRPHLTPNHTRHQQLTMEMEIKPRRWNKPLKTNTTIGNNHQEVGKRLHKRLSWRIIRRKKRLKYNGPKKTFQSLHMDKANKIRMTMIIR